MARAVFSDPERFRIGTSSRMSRISISLSGPVVDQAYRCPVEPGEPPSSFTEAHLVLLAESEYVTHSCLITADTNKVVSHMVSGLDVCVVFRSRQR